MMRRSGKFYRKNEAEVMERLGLKPTNNSGSGWVEKEDGQNDFIICQLKSTDAQSIKINQKDIRMLEYNATVSHKLPVFAIQFFNTGEVWLMAKPEDFILVSDYIQGGKPVIQSLIDGGVILKSDSAAVQQKKIVSSGASRKRFYIEESKKYDKTKGAT